MCKTSIVFVQNSYGGAFWCVNCSNTMQYHVAIFYVEQSCLIRYPKKSGLGLERVGEGGTSP